MIYLFSMDDEDYETEVSVMPGRPASGPTLAHAAGDPPEPAEIEILHIWFSFRGQRVGELLPHGPLFREVERGLLNCTDDILKQAYDEAMAASSDAAEAMADLRKEDF